MQRMCKEILQHEKKHQRFLLYLFFLLLPGLGALSIPAPAAGGESAPPPNVLLITIDTLRADRLGSYGARQPATPNLDRLAERGVLFSRAFAVTPSTLPSHTNILLGTTPLFHGVHDNSHTVVAEEFLTLAEHLRKHGYTTGAFVGAFPLDSRFGLSQGFETYDDDYQALSSHKFAYGERKAEEVVDRALTWLEERRSPWFIWIHCFDPHHPYTPPEPFRSRYAPNLYDGEVAYVDTSLGVLFDYLHAKDLLRRTVVVFTADHGESLGQHGEMNHGFFAYNTALWVPLVITAPGFNPARVEQTVSHLDIFPTLCEILGLEKPPFLQGISLVPAMKNKKLPQRTLYLESMIPYLNRGWAPQQGFLRGEEKFIESPIPELYDLEKDFDETHNLAAETDLGPYRKELSLLIRKLSRPDISVAAHKVDRETMRKLSSLGYLSSISPDTKKTFGPQDDVKVLLPYYNQAVEALERYQAGRKEEGIKRLKEVIAKNQRVDVAYNNLAFIHEKAGNLKEAIAVLEQGLRHHPESYLLLSSYVHYLIYDSRYDEVIRVVRKHVLPQMDTDPEIWNCLGLALWKKGKDEEAVDAFERATALDGEYANAFSNLGAAYLSLFFDHRKPEHHEKSVRNYNRALEIDPGHISAWNGLGYAYREAGDVGRAISCWEKAVELDPRFSSAVLNLGWAYLEKGEKEKALRFLTRNKQKYYHLLTPAEKQKLDALIEKCIQEP